MNCNCTGVNIGVNTATFGANFGTSCSAWDQTSCSTWYPDTTGPWCCQSWCYVDPSCSDSYGSVVADNLYYSYTGSCGNQEISSCPHQPPDPCTCINVSSRLPAVNASVLGMNYGTSCLSWDLENTCASYAPGTRDYWCCSSWCWVYPTCSSALPSQPFPGRDLYWTDDHCEDNSTAVAQCPYKRRRIIDAAAIAANASAIDPRCACIGFSPNLLRSGRRRMGKPFSSDYGSICNAWDVTHCREMHPQLQMSIWCCQSWCYVDEACPSANPSLIIPGYFWSYQACPDNGNLLASCSYSNVCRPTGANTGLRTTSPQYVAANNYGTSCGNWDAQNCASWYSNTASWAAERAHNWCCKSWAFVSETCPIAVRSRVSDALFYATGICVDGPALVYDNAAGQCRVGANSTTIMGAASTTSMGAASTTSVGASTTHT